MQAVVARERSARDGLLRREDRCRRDCRWELRRELGCWEAQALFGPEIEHARCTGELCPVLFQLICDVGRVWNTDVQEIEGCNNTIQHISKLAPSMSWMLLSARVMTKKLIALPPTRAAKSEFLTECELRHTKAATIVRSEKDRWMQPARVCLGGDAAALGKHHRRKPELSIAPCVRWVWT